jgi:hypothetical protein
MRAVAFSVDWRLEAWVDLHLEARLSAAYYTRLAWKAIDAKREGCRPEAAVEDGRRRGKGWFTSVPQNGTPNGGASTAKRDPFAASIYFMTMFCHPAVDLSQP